MQNLKRYGYFCQIGIAITITGAISIYGNTSSAQIAPDNTLGAESSVVTPNIDIKGLPSDRIDGGAIRGSGLFHSFQEFNVQNGRGAYFNNPIGIENIFSRVTGGNASNISGTLGVLGNANLFLLNPNGIIFGPNARLDMGGSFFGSTANSLNFEDGKQFSATNPNAAPLLNVTVPLGVQFGSNPKSIEVKGSMIELNDGKTLALIGGNVSMDGGQIVVRGGRIELGGLAEAGILGLNIDSNSNLNNLSFPDGVARADVSIKNGTVEVTSNGGGSIVFNARNIDILGQGKIAAGISVDSELKEAQAGNITVNATGTVMLKESSEIINQVDPDGVGSAGNIYITVGSLDLSSGSQLSAITLGEGKAGNVIIEARDKVSLDGASGENSSAILASVGENAVGQGGNINIETGTLLLTNGAQLLANAIGQGSGGKVIINARSISIDGASDKGSSGIITSVEGDPSGTTSTRKGGEINIETGTLLLTNGAQINAVTEGNGNAGNVIIEARSISLDGASDKGSSAILASVGENAEGQGGDIEIKTETLSLTNGAQINAVTEGKGDAGKVIINARTISLDGTIDSDKLSSSLILASVGENAEGQGGDIEIKTETLSLTNGAELLANAIGKGSGGKVIINAHSISIDGESDKGSSGIITSVEGEPLETNTEEISTRKGGDIIIETGTLSVTNKGIISANTAGQGNAGNINIHARDRVSLAGGGEISSGVESKAEGKGGVIIINTDLLSLKNNAVVKVNSDKEDQSGSAGDIEVTSRSIVLDRKAEISAKTDSGEGGNIELKVRDLLALRRQSQISTTAGVAGKGGDGGNINIDADATNGFIIAAYRQNNDITANAFEGNGGKIDINAFAIVNMEKRSRDDLRRKDPNTLNPNNLTSNDITAFSRNPANLSGEVNTNALFIDPTRGLIELPEDLGDSSKLITQSCPVGRTQAASRFVVTGRGGLPPSPSSALSSDALMGNTTTSASPRKTPLMQSSSPSSILVEARGVNIGPKGEIIFTANPSKSTSHNSLQKKNNTDCNAQ